MGPDTFSGLFAALYRQRLTVLLVTAGAVAGGWFFARGTPPLYQARTALFVPTSLPVLSLSSEDANLPDGPVIPDTSESTRIGLLGLATSERVFARVQTRIPELDEVALRRNLILNIDPYERLVVTATDVSQERAAQVLETFLEEFREALRELVEREPRRSLAVLEEEEPAAWAAYRDAQDAWGRYLESLESPDPEVDLRVLIEERQQILDAVSELEVAERRSAAQRPVLEAQLEGRPEFLESRRTLVQNPSYREARSDVSDLRAELATARLRYRDEHSVVREIQLRLGEAEARLREELDRGMVLGSTEYRPDEQTAAILERLAELDVAEAGYAPTRAVLNARLASVEERLQGLPLNRARLTSLAAEVTRRETHAERVSQRAEELRLTLQRGFDFAFVDREAGARPDIRVLPSLFTVLLFSAIAGLTGGVLLAVALELIHQVRLRRPY